MRKLLVPTAIATVAALAVTGCSSSSKSAAGSPTSSGPAAATTGAAAATSGSTAATSAAANASASGMAKPAKAYKLAFIQGVAGDAFYITMQCGIQAEAKALGVTVTTQGPAKFDPTLQTPILQSVIASKPDAILIAPTDVTALQKPIEAAKAAGIKIVLVDTTLKDPSVAVSAISSDNVGGGAAAFKALETAAPGGGKVLVINQQPGVSTTDARGQGFLDAVKTDPKFTSIGQQYAQNDPQKAATIVAAAIQKNPDLVGVFAVNLFAAEGTATGVRQAGKAGKVKIVGFDAGPDQIKALQDGTVQALVAQQPGTIGKDGVDQAILALEGKPTTAKIGTASTVITKASLSTPAGQAAEYKASC